MPVNILWLEGNLDGVVLGPVLNGTPAIETGCSKGSLGPRCLDQRRGGIPRVCYLRDRDYDFEPPAIITEPVVDRVWDGITLGWRWCRHEIENYLLDPAVVAAATGWDQATYSVALIAAGLSIRDYQIARWSLGRVKRVLPPGNQLPGRPVEFDDHDFRLAADLSANATAAWARNQVTTFRGQVSAVIDAAVFDQNLADRALQLTEGVFSTPDGVLTWSSGKDLFAALTPWLHANHHLDDGRFRAMMRDWIAANPEPTVLLLPEWQRLREILVAYA
jgi:hypothetical protein